MGKAAASTPELNGKSKNKGRPPNKPLSLSTPPPPPPQPPLISYDSPATDSNHPRSTRAKPHHFNSPVVHPEFEDDDDERHEKKAKLVVRLPQSGDDKTKAVSPNKQNRRQHSPDSDSGLDSDHPDSEEDDGRVKKRKINAAHQGSKDGVLDQEKKVVKTKDTTGDGSSLVFGPTTPLPDTKILVFILDRLQKKDIYGVFSEPVDPNELPDYFEIIEQPMDFGTVREKLDGGSYKKLEELEADVFLICSNAMQYNAPDTIYYRQARSIHELAKRDFENLKREGEDGEPQPKVVRRGRPPSSKNQKKSLETSRMDRAVTELSSGATLASSENKATGSSSYNLMKGSSLYKFRSTDPFVSCYSSRNDENYSEWPTDWNNEFPASIIRADMKYGKKQFSVDENRRDTYRQFHALSSGFNSRSFSDYNGDMKRLVPVGLQEHLAYARSLARYAATLGTVAWKIASKKVEFALPAGIQYGPCWVGKNAAPSHPPSFSSEKQKLSNSAAGDGNSSELVPPVSDLSSAVAHGPCEGAVNAVGKPNSQDESRAGGEVSSSGSDELQAQQNHVLRNGFCGMFGHDSSTTISEEAGLGGTKSNLAPGYHQVALGRASDSQHGVAEKWNFSKSSWPALQVPQTRTPHITPDLNARVAPAGSPSSTSMQIGSPQQPDLALQL